MGGWVTWKDAAGELGVSLSTLKQQAHDGELPRPAQLSTRRVAFPRELIDAEVARRKGDVAADAPQELTEEEAARVVFGGLVALAKEVPECREAMSLAAVTFEACQRWPQFKVLFEALAHVQGVTPAPQPEPTEVGLVVGEVEHIYERVGDEIRHLIVYHKGAVRP